MILSLGVIMIQRNQVSYRSRVGLDELEEKEKTYYMRLTQSNSKKGL